MNDFAAFHMLDLGNDNVDFKSLYFRLHSVIVTKRRAPRGTSTEIIRYPSASSVNPPDSRNQPSGVPNVLKCESIMGNNKRV